MGVNLDKKTHICSEQEDHMTSITMHNLKEDTTHTRARCIFYTFFWVTDVRSAYNLEGLKSH